MELEAAEIPAENFVITCKNYPSEFILDKNVAKNYFRQFGRLKKLTFRPKVRTCTVEYANKTGYLNALNNSGEYKGNIFEVSGEKSPEKKKLKRPTPTWVDNDEVRAELIAMSGFAPKGYEDLTEGPTGQQKVEKVPKLKRSWTTEVVPKAKKKPKIKEKSHPKTQVEDLVKHTELINIIKSQAITVEEKYKVLDARDKLIRLRLNNKKLKSSPTLGTCPDMCPEKERLMRETQHQVALYEQEDNGRSMNPSKAIKQYSRSSADQEFPLPHELRPVSVLQMTMSYLMHKIIDISETNEVNLAEWYHFLWDRTRGIRKDITQQELCSQGAVELIEQCARFHIHCSARLVAEDPSVFDQKINTENLTKCLQSLKYMYHDLSLKGEHCRNEAEFRAYIILLNLNDGNFMWEVQELHQDIQKSKEVKFALQVYSALDKNNYVKFFKLVHSTTYLNACILMRYFVQVRLTAIKTLLKCYTSRAFRTVYPLEELMKVLAFDDMESTEDFLAAYGLFINDEKTHIVLDKNTFGLPELPYVLDRSLNVVESKRTCSVGRIVCGKDLPDRTFENHVPQNSFDDSGRFICDDLFDIYNVDQAQIAEEATENTRNDLAVEKDESNSNILIQQDSNAPSTRESDFGSIFRQEKKKETLQPKAPPAGFFSKPIEAQLPIFAKDGASRVFGAPSYPEPSLVELKDETDSKTTTISSFFPFSKPTFASKPTPEVKQDTPPFTVPKYGGFHFDLPEMTQKLETPAAQALVPVKTMPDLKLEENLKEIERKKQEIKQREEEQQRRMEELKRELEEATKREEERLRMKKKQKQEEALKKRMEELKKEEENQKIEIQNTVRSVLKSIVDNVDEKMCQERLKTLKKKMRHREMLAVVRKWREIVVKNKRKRKAMDCSPVWINTKTVEQSAKELHTASQDLTLKLRKRYKYGKALDIVPVEEDKITKINLFQLTYGVLNQRYFHLKGTLQKNIFWKVEISLPDHYELRNGLIKIEDTLKEAFGWEDRNGTMMMIEQVKPNVMQSVTYCIERQRGLYVRYGDANGIIFIAKDFNSLLQRRILENLKDLGVFTTIPIVIILQEYKEDECKLKSLIEENIVSNYLILIQNITPRSLVNLVEEALVFLAGKIEKPPPLELDTLNSFLNKYLCTEIWKRANSFAKWNSYYKSCLRDPNMVINLYIEALEKLKKIVLSKSCFEYPSFPEVFKDYLQSEIPDFLPCNYQYFPKFWKNEAYISKLEKILNSFKLPNWLDKWPPSNELELEVEVSKYCTRVFSEPEKPFYKVMSVLLRNVDPNDNFEDLNTVLWTDVIEILALEKLNEANLNLSGTQFETKSVFNQFIVVYDVDTLESYKNSDWFYLNHPMVKKYVEREMRDETVEEKDVDDEVEVDLDGDIDLDRSLREVSELLGVKKDYSELKKELEEISKLMDDLEDGIKVGKKISWTIGENLKKAIAEN